MSRIEISREEIELAVAQSKTMREASLRFSCCYRTFERIARGYGLYHPTPNGLNQRIPLGEILEGKHPSYPTSHLARRLVKEGVKPYRCEKCRINKYNGKHISLELDHIDGNSHNHRLENLQLLCPNCHSQTPTYRSKKLKWRVGRVAEGA